MIKNNELIKAENNGVASVHTWSTVFPQLEEFTKKLHEAPPKAEIQQNDGRDYLPISYEQTKLDEIYAGLWNWTLLREQVVANEIIATGLLEVFHPVAGVWIKRTGTAAVMIQIKAGSELNLQNKIKNTLVKDFPHLEAECLKSACKKLGPMFGRDLNRKFTDTYQPIYGDEVEANVELEAITDQLKGAKNIDELLHIWNERPDLHANAAFKKKFTFYRQSLNLKK